MSRSLTVIATVLACVTTTPVFAARAGVVQEHSPRRFTAGDLDQLVGRVALYPDPLLAQVLVAATHADQIAAAAEWADRHQALSGPELAAAIQADHLPWDASVHALLPFPTVLQGMAADLRWTTRLGSAFAIRSADVLDAVQRRRREADEYGFLRSTPEIRFARGDAIGILPVDPALIVIPMYDPSVVFERPRPGYGMTGFVRYGVGVHVGTAFVRWGWGSTHIAWQSRAVMFNSGSAAKP
jgi:hypothetical protein